MSRKSFVICLLTLIAIQAVSSSAWARHRYRSSDSTPGAFDYYLLSLSWSPAFCLQSPGAAECGGPRRFGFIVHGLWPQNERGWPENCGGADLPDDVVQGIADLMPAHGLVYHEWRAHGTCSGLAPADFFALVRRAFQSIAIPATFVQPTNALQLSPSAVTTEFLKANPRLPVDSVVTICSRQGASRLREVHVCFGRDLAPRACSAEALNQACRSDSIIVPPIR